MTISPLTFTAWTATLAADGYTVLPSSHAVPVQLWLRDGDGQVLHFLARGTRITLRSYRPSDLTGLILRSECDCAEHRTAGAAQRTVLVPGAVPLAESAVDGRRDFGWRGIEAGLLDVPSAAAILDRLLAELSPVLGGRQATARREARRVTAVA